MFQLVTCYIVNMCTPVNSTHIYFIWNSPVCELLSSASLELPLHYEFLNIRCLIFNGLFCSDLQILFAAQTQVTILNLNVLHAENPFFFAGLDLVTIQHLQSMMVSYIFFAFIVWLSLCWLWSKLIWSYIFMLTYISSDKNLKSLDLHIIKGKEMLLFADAIKQQEGENQCF